jgi:hypothetical protein
MMVGSGARPTGSKGSRMRVGRWSVALVTTTLVALPLGAQADVDSGAEAVRPAEEDRRGQGHPPWADEDWDGGPPPWAGEDGPPDWVPGPPPWSRGHEARERGRADGEHPPGPPPWAGEGRGEGAGPPDHAPGPPPWAGKGRGEDADD